jgi:hypothetical protein
MGSQSKQRSAVVQNADRSALGERSGWKPPQASLLAQHAVKSQKAKAHQDQAKSIRAAMTAVKGLKTGHLPQMLGQYVDPLHHKPMRLPDVSSATCLGTAVSTISMVAQIAWPATAPSTSRVPIFADDFGATPRIVDDVNARAMVVVRDPICMGILQAGVWDVAVASTYQSTINFPVTSPVRDRVSPGVSRWVEYSWFQLTAGPLRYENAFLAVAVDDASVGAVWIDSSATNPSTVTYSVSFNVHTAMRFTMDLVLWRDDTEFDVVSSVSQSIATGTNTVTQLFSLPVSGYWSLRTTFTDADDANPNSAIALITETVAVAVTTAFTFIHLVHESIMDEITATTSTPKLSQIRVLGHSVLLSNSTADMFKSGQLYARQIDGTRPWFQCLGTPEQFTMANPATSYDAPMDTGIYAYVKPQGIGALDLHDVLLSGPLTGTSSVLVNIRPFKFQGVLPILMIPSLAASNGATAVMTYHLVRGIEFATQSQLFQVDVASIPRAELLHLLDLLAHTQQFYENPLHLRDIGRALAKAGKWAWDNKAEIGSVAKAIAAILSKMPLV